MRWDDNFALGRFLNAVRAEYKEGDILAPCPRFSDAHPPEAEDPLKVVISRGHSFPLLLFCRTCRHAGSRSIWNHWQLNRRVVDGWFEEADEAGYHPFEDAAPTKALPPLGTLDSAYEVTLHSSPASDSESAVEWLAARGVDAEMADDLGYGWFPGGDEWASQIIDNAALQLADIDADHGINEVPGFNHPSDLRGPAVAIPCRAEHGWIHGIKLRLLTPGKFRGRQLSSQKSGGNRARVGLHFPLGNSTASGRRLIITEGERKADVVRKWANDSTSVVIGMPGVGNTRLLTDWLDERGGHYTFTEVWLAFDQDTAGRKASVVVADLCRQLLQVEPAVLHWVGGKGIDDAIVAGRTVEVSRLGPLGGSPTPLSTNRVTALWSSVLSLVKKSPIPAFELYRLYPQHEDRCRAMVRRGELVQRKVVGIGPVMLLPDYPEEEWDSWLLMTRDAACPRSRSPN